MLPALVLIVSVVAGCTAPAAAPSVGLERTAVSADVPNSIKVGAVIPLTGRYAPGGAQIKHGYELAVDDINTAGGVDLGAAKIPLELIVLDDESDAIKTVQSLESLYANEDVVAYLGGFGSDLHAAAAGIAEKNRVPYLGVAFALHSIHQQGFKYLFSPFPKSPEVAVSTFDILDTLAPRPTTLAIFAEKTDWGAELGKLWKAEADARGYGATTYEYAPGSTDFSSIILAARDVGSDFVLAVPNPPDALAIAKQMKELEFNPAGSVFIRGADSPAWAENLGADGDYFVLMTGWNNRLNVAGAAEMAARYLAKYDGVAAATTGPAYAAVQILADAISRAGTLDRDAMRDAIAATDLDTVIGHVTFRPDGTGNVMTIFNQWQSGAQVLVWPPEVAVGGILYPSPAWGSR
jgi:branched-chain amino acid transport system substrate-binding protein